MTDVFISYSRKNKAFVQGFAEALKTAKREIWVDWEGIPLSAAWWQEIESGIEHANTFVFIITPDSVRSEVCGQEIEHAIKMGKRIVPIIQNDDLADCQVHPTIGALNWIYFREQDDFDKSFQDLLKTLDTDLDHLHTHTRLLNRALEWDNKARDKDFLLLGRDLQAAQHWLTQNFNHEPIPLSLHVEYIVSSENARLKKQKRIFTSVLVSFVLTLFLAAFAERQRQLAVSAKNEAEKNHIVALSALGKTRLLKDDQLGSLLNGVQAFNEINRVVSQKPEKDSLIRAVRDSLHEALYANYEINRLDGHTDTVLKVVFNPTQDIIASVSLDKTLRLWQSDGQLLKIIPHNAITFTLNFSPDGEKIAVATLGDGIYLYDLQGHKLKHLALQSNIHSVLFSIDGRYLYAGGKDGVITIWDLDKTTALCSLTAHKGSIEDLSITSNGRWLASASSDSTVGIWDVAHCRNVSLLREHEDRVYSVSFSHDGTVLASASADNSIKLWKNSHPDTQPEQWQLASQNNALSTAHSNWVYSVRFNPVENTFASASADGMVKLWSHDGTLLKTFRGHTGAVQALSFSRDGQQIATASTDKSIKIFSLAGNLIEILQGHTASLKDIVYSPSGEWLATTGSDKTVIIWNKAGLIQRRITYNTGLRALDFSPDGKWLVGAGYDNTIVLWENPENNTATRSYSNAWSAHDASVKSVQFSHDGQYILSASADKTMRLWTLKGEFIKEFKGHTDAVNDAAFTPDDKTIISGSSDYTVKVWDVATAQILHTVKHDNWVNRINISPDGKTLASASSDRSIKLWSIETGELLKTFTGHSDWVWDVRFSPDGKTLASGGADNALRLWDIATGKIKYILKEHSGWIRALAFNPQDSSMLATASSDMSAMVWSLDKLKEDIGLHDTQLQDLATQACKILHNYLHNNSRLSENDRKQCQ